eukprot:8394027-Pyramimonas_sp.AAC.1
MSSAIWDGPEVHKSFGGSLGPPGDQKLQWGNCWQVPALLDAFTGYQRLRLEAHDGRQRPGS